MNQIQSIANLTDITHVLLFVTVGPLFTDHSD